MTSIRRLAARLRAACLAVLAPADRAMNRLFGHEANPLYHSGVLVVVLLVVLLLTGVYLLVFYRIGDPHGSVTRIAGQTFAGGWIRALHRYASDAAVVAIAVHAFRLFAQNRSWGPRALAWVTGLILLFVLFISGWTGYVMVWDAQAQLLAVEGARWLDIVPVFSEPIGRAFVGEADIPPAFFFLNLFAHIALPIGMFVVLWLHVSRVARPVLSPPRRLLVGVLGLLLLMSFAWPVGMEPPADPLRIPDRAVLDVFYTFWLPVTRLVPAGAVWVAGLGLSAVALLTPLWSRPIEKEVRAPSWVNPRLCTGCEQCYQDCPYEAIAMVERPDRAGHFYGHVDPALCVSCGICAGSCAPMGVGPPGMTGRDQLRRVEEWLEQMKPGPDQVVLVACEHGAAGTGATAASLSPAPLGEVAAATVKDAAALARGAMRGLDAAPTAAVFGQPLVFSVPCAGNLHTSVIEYIVRAGAGAALVVACAPRDCWSREGPKWLLARMYEDREAELKPRVDRRRVRVVNAAPGEEWRVREQIAALAEELAGMERAAAEERILIDTACELDESGQPIEASP